MEPPKHFDPEDELKAENELLKLKLELEHGMKESSTSSLIPEVENLWLNNVYNFEQQCKDASKVKVYDFIGRPDFIKLDELKGPEVSKALERLLSVMGKKRILLDCCCEYEDALIYKFITEELFEHEMDDISIEGMMYHFNYEEFHPNHDYDLRRHTTEFIENLLEQKWNSEFDTFQLSNQVTFNETAYNSAEISGIIIEFQHDRTFHIDKLEITQVIFDIEKGTGAVQGFMAYYAYAGQLSTLQQGHLEITFTYEGGYWYIKGFRLPDFG